MFTLFADIIEYNNGTITLYVNDYEGTCVYAHGDYKGNLDALRTDLRRLLWEDSVEGWVGHDEEAAQEWRDAQEYATASLQQCKADVRDGVFTIGDKPMSEGLHEVLEDIAEQWRVHLAVIDQEHITDAELDAAHAFRRDRPTTLTDIQLVLLMRDMKQAATAEANRRFLDQQPTGHAGRDHAWAANAAVDCMRSRRRH